MKKTIQGENDALGVLEHLFKELWVTIKTVSFDEDKQN